MDLLIRFGRALFLFARLYGTGPRSSGSRIEVDIQVLLLAGNPEGKLYHHSMRTQIGLSRPLGEMEQDCQWRRSSLSSEGRIVSIGPDFVVPRACLKMGFTTGCSDAAISYITRSRRQGFIRWSLARPGFGINGLRR